MSDDGSRRRAGLARRSGVISYTDGSAYELLAHHQGLVYVRVKSAHERAKIEREGKSSTENWLVTSHWDEYGTMDDLRECNDQGEPMIAVFTTHYRKSEDDGDGDDEGECPDVLECNTTITRAEMDAIVPRECVLVDNGLTP